jgi:hypothetical protein
MEQSRTALAEVGRLCRVLRWGRRQTWCSGARLQREQGVERRWRGIQGRPSACVLPRAARPWGLLLPHRPARAAASSRPRPAWRPASQVIELLEAAEAKAYYGLAINWKPLEALSAALLERGVLQGKEVRRGGGGGALYACLWYQGLAGSWELGAGGSLRLAVRSLLGRPRPTSFLTSPLPPPPHPLRRSRTSWRPTASSTTPTPTPSALAGTRCGAGLRSCAAAQGPWSPQPAPGPEVAWALGSCRRAGAPAPGPSIGCRCFKR